MDLLKKIVEMGLREGASFCEARYFEERGSSISVDNGVAKALSSGILKGVGLRVIVGGRWGFSSTSMPTRENVKEALKDTVSSARSIAAYPGEEAEVAEVKPSVDTIIYDVRVNLEDISPEEKVKRVLEIEREC